MFTICGLNLDIVWKEKQSNFNAIEESLQDQKADLFLLPEMFATGFCMEAEEIADQQNETLIWMQQFAKTKQSAIAGSVSVKEGNHFYNRFYFVKPEGNVDYYDKKHLFSYAGEDRIYTSGKASKIVEYKNIRFLLQVCYDLRFPVFSRNNEDYDVALYVANWPKTRVFAWQNLLIARAIENQSYVVGLNRIGIDGNLLEYDPSSTSYFADGSLVSITEDNRIITEIDLDKLQAFRNKFPFLKDRDFFEIK